ncbi:MAG: hypothetical protein LPK85_02870, partial [Gammaproteobacteria bacterium]|nr:hypothetical protein [Gammaproteobacteria bacterium]
MDRKPSTQKCITNSAFGSPRRREDFHAHAWIGFRIKETQQLQPIFLPDASGEYLPYDLERRYLT